ncbi:hypothetical protein C5Z26_05160 [Lactobacillus sp. CBA3606]|uniref:hypothetical protein n=1 Tax=Lactobacillus sp. CBA3606 TaxID=2099789 RepID=UPI000CFAB6AE|nr:hypothetical protein [Lactobacillus sp. CBA3606]AVK63529.1 hypothetical protein C5Z26_05160 [Lactobacillus sp. CBA3606]
MRKMIMGTSVLVGVAVLGGGYLLWPESSQTTTQPVHQAVSSSVKSTKSTKSATKQQSTSQAKQGTTATSASQSNATTSQKAATSTMTATSAATTESKGSTSASSTTNSSHVTDNQSTSQSAVTATQLTTAQLNDWVWQQVAQQYTTISVTKADFLFNQYRAAGLVYVAVYENTNDRVSHLVGNYRVNAKGQLERQATMATTWTVVSATYNN